MSARRSTPARPPRYLALSGGVGGARLVDGLARVLPPQSLSVAVNVGDDFEHLGLPICPDLDTVLYTLAGLAHPVQGWGRGEESWQVQGELQRLGAPDWFALGDRDLALHLTRRDLLARGLSLSAATAELAGRLGVLVRVMPVSDERVATMVDTGEGELAFQDYFVRRRCEPVLRALRFAGAASARLAPALDQVLGDPALAGVIVCPSNPYLSVAPMLATGGLRERLGALAVPVIAVSPIIGGAAVKGPTAKIMRELGVAPNATVIGELYRDFVDAIVIDEQDAALAANDPRIAVAATLMSSVDARVQLARFCVGLIGRLAAGTGGAEPSGRG